jgi:hypothetical protein
MSRRESFANQRGRRSFCLLHEEKNIQLQKSIGIEKYKNRHYKTALHK